MSVTLPAGLLYISERRQPLLVEGGGHNLVPGPRIEKEPAMPLDGHFFGQRHPSEPYQEQSVFRQRFGVERCRRKGQLAQRHAESSLSEQFNSSTAISKLWRYLLT